MNYYYGDDNWVSDEIPRLLKTLTKDLSKKSALNEIMGYYMEDHRKYIVYDFNVDMDALFQVLLEDTEPLFYSYGTAADVMEDGMSYHREWDSTTHVTCVITDEGYLKQFSLVYSEAEDPSANTYLVIGLDNIQTAR